MRNIIFFKTIVLCQITFFRQLADKSSQEAVVAEKGE
jgi:hypothetical protein